MKPFFLFPSPSLLLQSTLPKPTRLTFKPNFAKELFSPSRSNAGLGVSAKLIDKMIENLYRQCLTKNIGHLADSANFEHGNI